MSALPPTILPLPRAGAIFAEMLDALRMAEPVLREVVAAGALPSDDMSDRLALDAVQTAIAKAAEGGSTTRNSTMPQTKREVADYLFGLELHSNVLGQDIHSAWSNVEMSWGHEEDRIANAIKRCDEISAALKAVQAHLKEARATV